VNACAEFAISLRHLGVNPGDELAFVVTVERVSGGQRVELERHPPSQPIRVAVPAESSYAVHWRA
jgi:hypothetical protein